MKLSIVSPVYKAEQIIPTLVERIENAVGNITEDYELKELTVIMLLILIL